MKGAATSTGVGRATDTGFNPRPREGGGASRWPAASSTCVSIHAPVKGAARPLAKGLIAKAVSIHAPVKGAARPLAKGLIAKAVSIHAPVKGAAPRSRRLAFAT